MIAAVVRALERFPVNSWRRIFVVYFVALTIGTHWPRLGIAVPGILPLDKILHMLAFGGLCGLLMLTRWLHRGDRAFNRTNILRCVIVAGVWSVIDELTQLIPRVVRNFDWGDVIANVVGVLIAGAVAWLVFARVDPQAGAQRSETK